MHLVGDVASSGKRLGGFAEGAGGWAGSRWKDAAAGGRLGSGVGGSSCGLLIGASARALLAG